jgi:hypothetical protein
MEDVDEKSKRTRNVRDGLLETMKAIVDENEPAEKKRALFHDALDKMSRQDLFGFYPHVALRLLPPSSTTFDLWLRQQQWKNLDQRQYKATARPVTRVRISKDDATGILISMRYEPERTLKWLTAFVQHARQLDFDDAFQSRLPAGDSTPFAANDKVLSACLSSPFLHIVRVKAASMSQAEMTHLFAALTERTTCGLVRVIIAELKETDWIETTARASKWKQAVCIYVNDLPVIRIPMTHDCSLARTDHQNYRICALPMVALEKVDTARVQKHLDEHGYNFVLSSGEFKSKEEHQSFLFAVYRLMLKSERFVAAETIEEPSQSDVEELPAPPDKKSVFIRALWDTRNVKNREQLRQLVRDLYDTRDRDHAFHYGGLMTRFTTKDMRAERITDKIEDAPLLIREFMDKTRGFNVQQASAPYTRSTSIGLLDPRGNWIGHVYVWPSMDAARTLNVMGIRASLVNIFAQDEKHVTEKLFAAVALFAWRNRFEFLTVVSPFGHVIRILEPLGFRRLRTADFIWRVTEEGVRKMVATSFPFENVVEQPMPIAFPFAAFSSDATLDDRKAILNDLQKEFPELNDQLLQTWLVHYPMVWRNFKSKDRIEQLQHAHAMLETFIKLFI